MDRLPLIIISGPTASGKSRVALEVAEKLGGEIISADSLQVYKYFDIVSDKAPLDARERIPHHLVDSVLPDEEFNAGIFNDASYRAVCEILEKKKVPIVCGGTGLYIKALIENLSFCGPPDTHVVKAFRKRVSKKNASTLFEELSTVDPHAAERIHPEDQYRVTRALEVFHSTGKTLSEFHKKDLPDFRFNFRYFVLFGNRETLYRKINRRVDTMVEKGVVEEIRGILGMGYSEKLKPFGAIGPAQFVSYLKGERTLDDAVFSVKRESRRFAKRQLTWFRKVADSRWISMEEEDAPSKAVNEIQENSKDLFE